MAIASRLPRWRPDPAVLVLLVPLLALWQGLAWAYASPFLPGPGAVAVALIDNWRDLADAVGATLTRAATALAISVAVAVPSGILCGRLRRLGALVDPLLEFIVTVPPPALIPVVMLLAGTGDGAKIAVVIYACAPSLLINAMEGVRQAPPMLHRVARSLRLTRAETMVLMDLPAALPFILTGLRLAVGASLLVTITAEMLLATDGIGTFVQRAQETFRMDGVLAAIACISATGLAVNTGTRALERRLLFWYRRAG